MSRRNILMVTAVLGLCTRGLAQMELSLTLDQSVYVVGEPVRADVGIVNQSPVPFGIGPGIDYRQNDLTFEIRDNTRDTLASRHPGVPLIDTLMLRGGEKHAAAFELDEWYPLTATGSYIVRAALRRDDRLYTSPARAINIVPGLELQSAVQLFAGQPGLQRKLSLVYYMRRQAEFLFLRCTDTPDDRIWTTLELGRLLRTTPPTLTVSSDGEVTILHRATQDMFLRTHIRSTADGVSLVGQDRVIDPESLAAARAQEALRQGAESKKNQGSHGWWPFGGSSGSGKNP